MLETNVYPLYLTNLAHVLTVVVGGGAVGERKIKHLLASAAQVRLISPQATPTLQTWAAAGAIEWWARPYQPGDLTGAFLAFAATNLRAVNAQVAQAAAALGVLCNVADAPTEGNFHVPAVHRQGHLVIAVGSNGTNPAQSKQVRDRIAAWLAQEADSDKK